VIRGCVPPSGIPQLTSGLSSRNTHMNSSWLYLYNKLAEVKLMLSKPQLGILLLARRLQIHDVKSIHGENSHVQLHA
jgi:hypothetical protein